MDPHLNSPFSAQLGADTNSNNVRVSTLPALAGQTAWKYFRTPDELRFTDGTRAYAFSFPQHTPGAGPIASTKKEGLDLRSLQEGAIERGTAQIHAASPIELHFTLQNGKDNPTYKIKFRYKNEWQIYPKVRNQKQAAFRDVTDSLQRASFFPGEVYSRLGGGIPGTAGTMAIGAGLGGVYHLLKRKLYNTPEENAAEGPEALRRRLITPAVGLGALSLGQGSLFKNLYKDQMHGASAASKLI